MPELPEVETTVRGLAPVLHGQRLSRVVANRADLRRAMPVDLGQRLTGASVTGLSRRAKYGVIDTDRGDSLIFHLGMSGRWRVDPEVPLPHDHLVLETASGRQVVLNDPRRFGSVDLMPTADVAAWPPFVALGPEPLGPELTADHLERRFAGRIAPIKLLLLDQRIVAGLGNIYVCEALNVAQNRPDPAGGTDRAAATGRAGRCDLARCCSPRSRRADRPCATMPGPMASSVIFPSSSGYMGGRARRVRAAAPSSAASMADAPPSGAGHASNS